MIFFLTSILVDAKEFEYITVRLDQLRAYVRQTIDHVLKCGMQAKSVLAVEEVKDLYIGMESVCRCGDTIVLENSPLLECGVREVSS